MTEFEPGEMIKVRNSDTETWVNRYYVAMHPFNSKIVTLDRTGILNSWFQFRKLNQNDTKTS